jgi:iron complex outermembrane receptor protein
MSKCLWTSPRKFLLPSCAIVSLLIGAGSANAQSGDQASAGPAASGSGVEEIVVTAERRTTNIQKTALSVTALKADSLEKSNVVQLADINGRVPSLTITKSSGYETVTTIRGIGYETTENEGSTTPGVALFIDGVYIANTIALDETLFDIDHLEVLRGPQGALYGQSATGGAISIVTKQPVLNEFSGTADVQLGDYNLHRERAELNIPVTDTIAIRVSAQNYGHDGFTKNVVLPNDDLDDANDVSGKFAILWAPTDDFKATLTTEFYSSDFNGASQKNVIDPNPDPWTVSQDYPSRFALNTNISHLNLEWDLPWFTVKSVSAYQYLDHHQQEDSSRTTYDILGKYDDVAAWNTKMYNYNEEFDLISNSDGPFDWTAGAFALAQKFQQYVAEFGGSTPPPSSFIVAPDLEVTPTSVSGISFGQKVVSDKESFAGFAQGTYHFTDELRLVGGARFNYDHYDFWTKNFGPKNKDPLTETTYQDRVPTFIGRLEYDLTPDNMLYGSVSRGYKPGGSNGVNGGLFNTEYPSEYQYLVRSRSQERLPGQASDGKRLCVLLSL